MNDRKRIILVIVGILCFVYIGVEAFIIFKKEHDINNKVHIPNVVFTLDEEAPVERTIEVNSGSITPDKVTVMIDDVDYSELVQMDDSLVNLNLLGDYIIKYYVVYEDKRYEQERKIRVVDSEAPKINMVGKNITILLGNKYNEPGYTVSDNYDKDLKDKVEIENNVNINKVGTYKVIYRVMDSSGNKSEVSRDVTVKKPNVVVATPPKEAKIIVPKVVENTYTNTIKKNKFYSDKIQMDGYLKEVGSSNKIKLIENDENKHEIEVDIKNNNYVIDINPNNYGNGTYKLYINEEPLLNKMAMIERLNRAKVGNKLVTFIYNDKDEVSIKIEDHVYLYDILINPGHGGEDTGAVNEYIQEKEMNLKVSMYEKCRYEAHGLKVYMTRVNDVYGNNFGPSGLIKLHKLAYEMGHFGAVSKIVYSNHHNSIGNNYYGGYEVLLAGGLTKNDITNEINIANKWNNLFTFKENHLRFYARDYDTEKKYTKLNGEVYSFKDNYAVNRIPYQTANVKSIIFEGCYMSNKEEFNWYWVEENWYKISEAKIEVYVNSLGVTYNPDNSSCV